MKSGLKVALRVALTGLVIGILVKLVGWMNLLATIKETHLGWMAFMLGAMLLGRLIEAVQMHVLLRKLQAQVTILRIFLANALSSLYALMVPGGLIAGVAKWLNLSAVTGSKSLVFSAIVYNRIALVIPPLLVGVISLAYENPFKGAYIVVAMAALIFVVVMIALSLFHPRLGEVADRVLTVLARPLPFAIRRQVGTVIYSLEGFRNFRFRDHSAIYALSLLTFITRVAALSFAMAALDVRVSVAILVWVIALLLVARQAPVTVSNLGVREAILIVVLGMYGVEPERAFAVGLILFSGQVLSAVVGLSYQVALMLGFARWRDSKAV